MDPFAEDLTTVWTSGTREDKKGIRRSFAVSSVICQMVDTV